ncbi:hypothetical protein [Hymenobacter latericus]|uniref:hypothetical protein n=1 Tax=Hymenobacter sp. YIM 151858-1 TaxID=2987688 RepID=UPI002227F9BC|nr:hypothetical protein [Hymenobacter sp. YIM 151858-1]UYZ59150.1 hypothetical protein OIS50_19110 [Hymenobacter sp. YIM 151858-1]
MEKKYVQHEVHLDAAAKLLGGDLQEEANRAGLDNNLQRWIEDLKDAGHQDFHELIVDLQALKAHFGGGAIDGKLVGQLLHRLGENTAKVAHLAEGNVRPRVENLSQALLEAAREVAGGRTSPDEDLRQDSAQRKQQ